MGSTEVTSSHLSVRQLMAKARSITGDVEESAALDSINQEDGEWEGMNAVLAPYDPASLLKYVEITPHLKPCIAAMAQNIDGYGYKAVVKEPWMDTADDEEAIKAIVSALEVERWASEQEDELIAEDEEAELNRKIAELRQKNSTAKTIRKYQKRLDIISRKQVEDVDDEEGESESLEDRARSLLTSVRQQIQRERYLFTSWFNHCCSEMSFIELRKAVRQDIESHGWGTIEWLRDRYDRLRRLQYVPAYTVRPISDEGEFVDVAEDDSITPFSEGRETIVPRKFRVYVQQVGSRRVYFKSPGDPRIVSQKTGKKYKTIEEMQAPVDSKNPGEGKDAVPANELMWIAKHDPTTPCPPPDWVGNLLSVLGGRSADETNYFYLDGNAIPSALLFVHGGVVPKATKERLEHRIQHEVQGPHNSGKILVVEARPGGKATKPGEKTTLPSITFQSLREAHTNDATFSAYDERGSDRIGASFRLSPILRGYTPKDLNRATAVAALYFAEQQVFSPLRDSFDWTVNKKIIPEIGIKFLNFMSNSPPTTSTEEIADFIRATAPHGTYTPEELREIAGDAMNRDFAHIDADWVGQPIQLTLNGYDSSGGVSPEQGDLNQRLTSIETKVSQIVTEELRAIGIDYDVMAHYVDEEEDDDPGPNT